MIANDIGIFLRTRVDQVIKIQEPRAQGKATQFGRPTLATQMRMLLAKQIKLMVIQPGLHQIGFK
jgi:hypothetical protein